MTAMKGVNNDEAIMEWWNRGLRDGCEGTVSIMPDDKLLVYAYEYGAMYHVEGDEEGSMEILENTEDWIDPEIVERVRRGYRGMLEMLEEIDEESNDE